MLAEVENYQEEQMDGEQLARELGEIRSENSFMLKSIQKIDEKLDAHVSKEEERLKRIEHQLSFGRFLLFTAKAIGATLILLVTFKVGDVGAVWKALIK
jgi:hypothetical protein